MIDRLHPWRAALLCAAFQLAIPPAGQAFTIHDPIAFLADDREAGAHLHRALERRFRNVVAYDTLAAVRARFDASGEPKIVIRITSSRDRSSATAYGATLPTCHVTVTAEVLRLPAAKLELTKSGDGKGPDCGAALAAASSHLGDELVRSLEEYRRHGTPEKRNHLWLELDGDWSDADLGSLRERLLKLNGIRRIADDSSPRQLKVEIYRDARALAREIDRLAAVRVTRLAGDRVTLSLAGSSAVAAQTPASAPPEPVQRTDVMAADPLINPIAPPTRPTSRETAAASMARIGEAPASRGRKWALIVGVSTFYDQAIPPLTFPVRDAEAFARVLRDPDVGRFAPEDVILLLDGDATTRRLKKELDGLARKTRPEDLFVFFFSSHASSGQHDTAGDAYLITHDTEKSDLYATGLPMRELVDALSQRIRARTVVSFLDACHTGQIVERNPGSFTGAKALDAKPPAPKLSWAREWKALSRPDSGRKSLSRQPAEAKKLVFISSSDGAQPSWESERLGHGFFTFYLMEALTRSRGRITVAELFDFLKVEVRRAALAEKGVLQEPKMFFNQDADIVVGYATRQEP